MSYQRWYSARDVQEDLRRVGQYGLGHVLDEGHVLVGEQPPRQLGFMLDEESELQMRSLCGGHLPADHNGVVQPDVAGISRLLRMIDGPDDEQEIKEEPQKEQTTNEVVVISKLNPNCREFIPSSCRDYLTNKNEVKEKEAPKNTDECVPMILDIGQIDINEKAKEEKEALEKKMKDTYLRKKIIETSNTVCPKLTKDRNVAIMSLLKLHSHNPISANNNTNGTIGNEVQKCKGDSDGTGTVPSLKTPAYYEKCPEKFKPPKCFEAKPANLAIPARPARIEKVADDEIGLAASIEESVNKVQKWLQDTSNTSEDKMDIETQIDAKEKEMKKVSIHLGPVTFKRKNLPASPSYSVNSDTRENQKPKKEKCEEYKPSEYAEQLARKYSQHKSYSDIEPEQVNILTWKIHVELKAKEERLRERALARARFEAQEQMDEASNTCVAS